jgi:hypothetical protein
MLKPLVLKPSKGIGPKNLNALLCSRALGIVLWASSLLGLDGSKEEEAQHKMVRPWT